MPTVRSPKVNCCVSACTVTATPGAGCAALRCCLTCGNALLCGPSSLVCRRCPSGPMCCPLALRLPPWPHPPQVNGWMRPPTAVQEATAAAAACTPQSQPPALQAAWAAAWRAAAAGRAGGQQPAAAAAGWAARCGAHPPALLRCCLARLTTAGCSTSRTPGRTERCSTTWCSRSRQVRSRVVAWRRANRCCCRCGTFEAVATLSVDTELVASLGVPHKPVALLPPSLCLGQTPPTSGGAWRLSTVECCGDTSRQARAGLWRPHSELR